jgi:transposase
MKQASLPGERDTLEGVLRAFTSRKEACMYYVGIDVHQRRSSVEILDCNGKRFKRFEVTGPWSTLADAVAARVPGPFAVCYEASCGYGYLYERFSRVARLVRAAHPAKLRLIFAAKRKHDRLDAAKLAKVLYLDAVPAVHVPDASVRSWRQSVEFRQRLLASLVAVKNQLRAFLKERGLASAAPRGLWTRRGLAWLAALDLGGGDEASALRRDLLLEQLAELTAKLKRVTGQLDATAGHRPGVALLRTIPGVGPRTAEALAAYVDDPRRFGNLRQVGAYFGWAPCQDASGDVSRLGHITRDGPATVRKLLCEAAWVAVRRSPTVRAFYERVRRDDPDRKKVAIVATAHYLTRVAAAMLRSGECWRER